MATVSAAAIPPDHDPMTMLDLLALRVASTPDIAALVADDQSLTFAEFDAVTTRLASALRSLGVSMGDTVAIMMANRAEFIAVWWGIAKAGGIEVPVNTAYIGQLLAYILEHSDAGILFVDDEFLAPLAGVAGGLSKLETVVLCGESALPAELARLRAVRIEELLAAPEVLPDAHLRPSTPAAIMYTSGTTGPSKGAVLPHNYFVNMGAVNASQRSVAPDDVLYTCLPLFHGNAQLLTFMTGVAAGVPVVLGRRFSVSGFWSEMQRHSVTQFNYIGTILTLLLKGDTSDADRDHCVRLAWGAGAKADVWEAFEGRFGVRVSEAYGMTENGMVLYSPLHASRIGSCGKPVAMADVIVADSDDCSVSPGVIGELLTRPRRPFTMMLGYHKMPEKTLEAFRNLWFHTGDAAYSDSDGYIFFVDRLKDAIRRRGENISSFEVEQIVNAYPGVLESAAVPVPSDLGEDEVLVCLVPRGDATLFSPGELVEFCRERMPAFMVPRYIRVIADLPKTPTERVEKYRLRNEGVTPDTWDAAPADVRQ